LSNTRQPHEKLLQIQRSPPPRCSSWAANRHLTCSRTSLHFMYLEVALARSQKRANNCYSEPYKSSTSPSIQFL